MGAHFTPYSLWGKPAPSPEEMPVWTTYKLAEYLDTNVTRVQRWCKKWFGDLGKGKNVGRSQGFQIPWEYVWIARGWLQTEDETTRGHIVNLCRNDPQDWVVVVDGIASKHYDIEAVIDRMTKVKSIATAIYVGEFKDRMEKYGKQAS